MPYDRVYGMQEIHDILCKSERRNKPGGHYAGHSIGLHADGRDDVTDRRYKSTILLAQTVEQTRAARPEDGVGPLVAPHASPSRDGAFDSRVDLIRAVEQALNSAQGRTELRKLDPSTNNLHEVRFTYTFASTDQPCKANASRFPTPPPGNSGAGPVQGPPSLRSGVATGIFLYVVRVEPPSPACEIHIQTAYPTDVR